MNVSRNIKQTIYNHYAVTIDRLSGYCSKSFATLKEAIAYRDIMELGRPLAKHKYKKQGKTIYTKTQLYRLQNRLCIKCGDTLPARVSLQSCQTCRNIQQIKYRERKNSRQGTKAS